MKVSEERAPMLPPRLCFEGNQGERSETVILNLFDDLNTPMSAELNNDDEAGYLDVLYEIQ